MSSRKAHILGQKWRSDDVYSHEDADFSSLLLSQNVLKGLKKCGFKKPSPIQLEAIPCGHFGQDLIVQSKSGTGKTLVFSILALELISPELPMPQVLILAPAREIAFQIYDVMKAVGSQIEGLKCCCLIGGMPISEDIENIIGSHIAVGTPGRVKQLIGMKILITKYIRLFVLDEADQLLERSFITDLDTIFLVMPAKRQVIATSATYPKQLQKAVVNRFFNNPYVARLNQYKIALLGMVHYICIIEHSTLPVLAYRVKLEMLEAVLTGVKFSQCLVFCNLVSSVESLCQDIRKWSFSAAHISSAKEQAARLKAIEALKRFKCKVLVSSDVSSRGIDAENVDLVVNFDCPLQTEIYTHRVGRAGRYGSKGVAITFLHPNEVDGFRKIEKEGHFQRHFLPNPLPMDLINIRPRRKYLQKYNESSSASDGELTMDGKAALDSYYNLSNSKKYYFDAEKEIEISSSLKVTANSEKDKSNGVHEALELETAKEILESIDIRLQHVQESIKIEKQCDVQIGSPELQTENLMSEQNSDIAGTENNYMAQNAVDLNKNCMSLEVETNNSNEMEKEDKVPSLPSDLEIRSSGTSDDVEHSKMHRAIAHFMRNYEKTEQDNLMQGDLESKFSVENSENSSNKSGNRITSAVLDQLRSNVNSYYYKVFKNFQGECLPLKSDGEMVKSIRNDNVSTPQENSQSCPAITDKKSIDVNLNKPEAPLITLNESNQISTSPDYRLHKNISPNKKLGNSEFNSLSEDSDTSSSFPFVIESTPYVKGSSNSLKSKIVDSPDATRFPTRSTSSTDNEHLTSCQTLDDLSVSVELHKDPYKIEQVTSEKTTKSSFSSLPKSGIPSANKCSGNYLALNEFEKSKKQSKTSKSRDTTGSSEGSSSSDTSSDDAIREKEIENTLNEFAKLKQMGYISKKKFNSRFQNFANDVEDNSSICNTSLIVQCDKTRVLSTQSNSNMSTDTSSSSAEEAREAAQHAVKRSHCHTAHRQRNSKPCWKSQASRSGQKLNATYHSDHHHNVSYFPEVHGAYRSNMPGSYYNQIPNHTGLEQSSVRSSCCVQPSAHYCHSHFNSQCQSQLCVDWYNMFQTQWQQIYYATHFR